MKEAKTINVLVTAIGGELSFSILKALQIAKLPLRIIGCDIYPDVVGKKWCEKSYQVPLASQTALYLEKITRIIKDENIHIIIPTSDHEFPIMASHKQSFLDKFGCHVLVQSLTEWNRFEDKWEANTWFVDHSISTPKTSLPDLFDYKGSHYPLIVKPRLGGGSRHIHKVKNEEELRKALDFVPRPIIQELIVPDSEEYTAGAYKSKSGEISIIVMQRELKFGMTNKAWVVRNAALEEFCAKTIAATNLIGSNNIQFRVNESGPKVLEINHRFSGTTGIRANFGFNDVEMWIRDVMDEPVREMTIKDGKVLRYLEEEYEFD